MRNTFGFRFLASPSNPRNDAWVGQAFSLSYLNSQPGNSYLFRFKPYWAGDSRLHRGPLLADRGAKTGGENRGIVYSQRATEKEAIYHNPIEFAVRRRLEALFSRNYLADVEVATGLVVELLNSDLEIRDARVDLITIADRMEAHSNTMKLFGPRSVRKQVSTEAITIAEMLLGYVRRHNNPEAIISRPQFGERDQRLHTAGYLRNYKRATSLREAYAVATKQASRNTTQIGITYRHDDLGFRPNVVHDAIEHVMYFGDKPDMYGWIAPIAKVGDTPTKIGLPYDELLIGQREDFYGWIGDIKLAMTEDKTAVISPDPIMVEDKDPIHAVVRGEQDFADVQKGSEARIDTDYARIEIQKGADSRIIHDITYAYGYGVQEGRYDLQQMERVDYRGFDAWEIFAHQFFDGPDQVPMNAWIVQDITRIEIGPKDARVDQEIPNVDYKRELGAGIIWPDIARSEKLFFKSDVNTRELVMVDEKARQAAWNPEVMIQRVEKGGKNSRIDWDATVKINKGGKDMRDPDFIDTKMDLLPLDARVLEEASVKVDKLQQAAWVINKVHRMDKLDKAAMIKEFWDYFEKLEWGALIEEKGSDNRGWKDPFVSRDGYIYDVEKLEKAEKDAIVTPTPDIKLLADKWDLDSLIIRAINLDRVHPQDSIISTQSWADRPDGKDSAILETSQAERDVREIRGLLQESIRLTDQVEPQRPAYIPVEGYILVGDKSDWEDVWNRYSPGLDVIDVPDSDFDYDRLSPQVYDPETGVPLKPLGPTNKPDVKVRYPLHHPVPSNEDVGKGRIVVDNYVLMDTILAVESLKNRNKLRFAGMPAEKTMREMLAKLFAWIEQAAPGNDEYYRTFRFVRWYSETVVMQLSTHILQRTYNSWLSQIHNNGDLGTKYTSFGWRYLANASVLQTTDTTAKLQFKKQNYIDGEITIRGYFDNPHGEGTMVVKVDGTTMSQLTTSDNGAFTLKFDLPAGNHNYEIDFNGASGRVSLSSLEITGCVFVGATTVADDSDTNGLKACTTLIQMLLVYFDRHHGDGKKKGTMAIKQRGLWNQT